VPSVLNIIPAAYVWVTIKMEKMLVRMLVVNKKDPDLGEGKLKLAMELEGLSEDCIYSPMRSEVISFVRLALVAC